VILDTSGLLTAYGYDQGRHEEVTETLRDASEPFILSPFVLAEADYMIASRLGVAAEMDLLQDVAAGVYRLADFTVHDAARACSVVDQYRDMNIGLADASIVVLAERHKTNRVLTFDHRHFRAMKPLQGGSFTILPADGDNG
jgi:predicted nucleic acid-binding protein